ncbi:hypothetical protein [uncultured Phascolarctobacterium sp.]|jgi:AraC-like DNA-binding protein|uniref:hypothetical protein n=1 Tax=uncultured Phascolarctobacterium sp. TaxID=512296 RepID=UPI0025CE4074|nr:hypothetical protein [uncultured Phascolarctobacterium sp.]
MDKINSQEVLKLKESVADAILMRIFGGKLANDNAELPVRTSFFNNDPSDYNIIDAHYQKLKEELCNEIFEKLVADKVNTEIEDMAVRAAYLADLKQKIGEQAVESIAVRLRDRGVSVRNIADIVNMSEEELKKFFDK